MSHPPRPRSCSCMQNEWAKFTWPEEVEHREQQTNRDRASGACVQPERVRQCAVFTEGHGGLPEPGMREQGSRRDGGEGLHFCQRMGHCFLPSSSAECSGHSSTCQMIECHAVWKLEESLIYSGCESVSNV